jgi:hypothetical protein
MITQEQLKEFLEYDKETGVFIRKIDWYKSKKGDIAGTDDGRGYKKIWILGKKYLLHRLAWLYVYGKFPDNDIDHINGNPSDNRIENLRDVSKSCNLQNQSRMHKNNKSGMLGVVAHYGKYRAQLTIKGITLKSKRFESKEEAHAEYIKMKRFYHGENCMI